MGETAPVRAAWGIPPGNDGNLIESAGLGLAAGIGALGAVSRELVGSTAAFLGIDPAFDVGRVRFRSNVEKSGT